MAIEAFESRKWLMALPSISSAGAVGTVMHETINGMEKKTTKQMAIIKVDARGVKRMKDDGGKIWRTRKK
jgi:hypothetical protein